MGASGVHGAEEILPLLAQQLCSPVLWESCIRSLLGTLACQVQVIIVKRGGLGSIAVHPHHINMDPDVSGVLVWKQLFHSKGQCPERQVPRKLVRGYPHVSTISRGDYVGHSG